MNDDLTQWRKFIQTEDCPVWQPKTLKASQWPPNYEGVYAWRLQAAARLSADPALLKSAEAYYAARPLEFILHWMDTYDPRRKGAKWIPFIFFERQDDLITFFESLVHDQEGGLVEKCRDMGATWLACGYSVARWRFVKGDSIGWGSRKQDLVDTIGDPDSIFEKMRLMLRRLPAFWLPDGFVWKKHATFMKLVNPANGATITGEAGDNIGRGGRKTIYFKDESAHYEHPEKIEAALGDNTNVQIDISSVNGLGNPFHRRRENGVLWYRGAQLPRGFTRVFVMDWRDHPAKNQEWYDARKAKAEREGMQHIFAQEVERDYAAAVGNTIIKYDWTQSAIDAHLKVPYLRKMLGQLPDTWTAGLDVADDGIDRNALAMRQWIIWRHVEEWGERDPGVSARRAIVKCREKAGRIRVMYDSIGVGAGVKTEYNRLTQDEKLVDPAQLPFVPWNAGASVLYPFERIIPDDDESMCNKDYYHNLKAQAWGSLGIRFYKTHKAVTEGAVYNPDELISLDSSMPLLEQLCKELAQATRGLGSSLRMVVDKKPEGMKSPNLADGGVMAYWPVPDDFNSIVVGTYG